ncbi:MAG: hypothetical protein U9O94_01955 [Nanoarchaeota archaeon]|nr:hypothetical protein [Nanoarchaeota archaeon]
MAKPIIKIDKFGGMGSKNTYYLEGFHPDNMSGQSVLSMGHKTTNTLSEEYANFRGCCDMTRINHEEKGQFIPWSGTHISSYDFQNTAHDIGFIHQVLSTGSGTDRIYVGSSSGSSIIATEDDHLLYTTAGHLGFGYLGECTSNGTTTTLNDSQADFTDIISADSSSTSKIYNFTTREEYTVSSVTTNQVTFTSAATTAPSDGDIYMFFVDGKWKFDVTPAVYDNHFKGQPAPASWHRRIVRWEDSYYIANGNYIAKLSNDLATFDATHKQLPSRTQCLELSYNSSRILISGDIDDSGVMILWDGKETGGFLNFIELDSSTAALTRHGSGFVFNIGAKLYYTDGYSYNDFATIPHVRSGGKDIVLDKLNNIKSVFGNIYMTSSYVNGFTAIKNGILVYDKEYGFTQMPLSNENSKNYRGADGLFFFREYGVNYNFVSHSDNEDSPTSYNVSNIYTSAPDEASVIFNIKLPQRTKVSLLELSLGQTFKVEGYDYGGLNADITVSACGGNKAFWYYGQVKSGGASITTSITNGNGVITNTEVGNEIFMLEGETGGERSFVTAITDGGTSSEVLTVSPAFSTSISTNETPNYNILPLKKSRTVNVTATDLSELLTFPLDGVGYVDSLYLEVYIKGDLDLDILNINVR